MSGRWTGVADSAERAKGTLCSLHKPSSQSCSLRYLFNEVMADTFNTVVELSKVFKYRGDPRILPMGVQNYARARAHKNSRGHTHYFWLCLLYPKTSTLLGEVQWTVWMVTVGIVNLLVLYQFTVWVASLANGSSSLMGVLEHPEHPPEYTPD